MDKVQVKPRKVAQRIPSSLLLVTLLVLTNLPLAAGELGNAEWKQVWKSRGIVGYSRPTPLCPIDEIKAVGVVEAPLAAVEAVIRDVPASTEFVFMCKESAIVEIPGIKNTLDEYTTYMRTHLPYPVNDRDTVARLSWTIDKATGTVYVHGKGIKTDYRLSPGVVRMPLAIASYILTPKGPDQTEVTYQALADTGGYLPAWLVKLLSRNLGVKTIAGIREMVKKDKYKHAAIVTTTQKQ